MKKIFDLAITSSCSPFRKQRLKYINTTDTKYTLIEVFKKMKLMLNFLNEYELRNVNECIYFLEDQEKKEKNKQTYVYLMIDKTTKKIKIGHSKTPKIREKTLLSQKPDIFLLNFWRAYKNDERYLHNKFSSKRVRGEWFDLTKNDIIEIHNYFSNNEILTLNNK